MTPDFCSKGHNMFDLGIISLHQYQSTDTNIKYIWTPFAILYEV